MSRRSRFRQLFGPDPQGDVDDELAFHLAMRVDELVARGEPADRARELARQRFGEFEHTRAACVTISRRRERRMLRMEWLREFVQDLGYAARLLRRTPGFALVAVLTLALGIGATSAVFTVVDAVLLEGLPYKDAERLHLVRTVYPDGTEYPLSAPDFMSVQALARSLDRVEAHSRTILALSGLGEPREARGARVSTGLFEMLGIGTALGRPFHPDEHQPGRTGVAVLDHGFWMRELGGDAAVLGRSLMIAGEPCVVIGVLPAGVGLPERTDVYLPLEYGETFDASTARGRRGEFLRVIGRAGPGQTADGVTADLRRVGTQLQREFPQTNERLTFGAAPVFDLLVKDARTPLLVLFGAVGLLLLVACANVANLLLARGSARRSELAVRAALGAGRGRLVRQLVAEALLLGVIGGALGAALASAAVRALVWARPADLPRLDAIAVDATVLLFTLACALLTALVFGVVPALHATGHRLLEFLRAGGRGAGDVGGARLRGALVVAETTLAVVLLVSAGLLVRSFIEMSRVHPGFEPDQAVSFRVMLQGAQFREREAVFRSTAAMVARLEALPGVTAAAAAGELPLNGLGNMVGFAVIGGPPPPPNVNAEIGAIGVTPAYLRAVGATLLRGRPIEARDNAAEAPPVALINEAGVAKWFAGVDPIGKRVDANGEYEIVGVVSDIRQHDLREPAAPQVIVPFRRMATRGVHFIVRGTGEVSALGGAIRRAIGEVDPTVPVSEFAPLEAVVATSMARPRFFTALLSVFAGAALVLAAVGLFGVLSYSVVQRTREIGVRLALGAKTRQVTVMIVGSALRLVGVGLVLGVSVAIGTGRVLRSQLFGVETTDALTIGVIAAVLALAALAASYLPARRAASLDPGAVLREG
jgi:putative ABC transport system permease protein